MKEIEEIKPFNLKRNISGGIDATIKHGQYGEIPTTLDGEQLEKAEAGEFGEVSPLTNADNERIAQIEQDAINAENLAYLASTDWYIVRNQETGTEIPDEILTKRQQAREEIQ
jgi:hypothetical protein